MAEGGSGGETTEGTGDKENQEPESAAMDDDEALDLENFGKKKKKKKKAYNLDELDVALPDGKKEVGLLERKLIEILICIRRGNEIKFQFGIFLFTKDGAEPIGEDGPAEDNFDLDMDFSKTKKKKKKKKDLDELVAEEEKKEAEDRENGNYLQLI